MKSMILSRSSRSANTRTLLLLLLQAMFTSQRVSRGTGTCWLTYLSKSAYALCYDRDTTLTFESRTDIITLQNPHGMPSVSVPVASSTAVSTTKRAQPAAGSKDAKVVSKPAPAGPIAAVKKAAEPCRFTCLSS